MLTLDSLAAVSETPAAETKALRWALPTRILFRFGVVYFGLYVFCTQMIRGLIVLPGFDLPPWETMWPFRTMVEWTAASGFSSSRSPV